MNNLLDKKCCECHKKVSPKKIKDFKKITSRYDVYLCSIKCFLNFWDCERKFRTYKSKCACIKCAMNRKYDNIYPIKSIYFELNLVDYWYDKTITKYFLMVEENRHSDLYYIKWFKEHIANVYLKLYSSDYSVWNNKKVEIDIKGVFEPYITNQRNLRLKVKKISFIKWVKEKNKNKYFFIKLVS